MSRDIFVQDLPSDARTTADIPHDFEPQPIGSSQRVVGVIKHLVPDADFSDPEWGRIEGTGFSIEVNVPQGDSIDSFALHVHGTGADPLITAILTELDLRALDAESESGVILPSN